MTKSTRILSLFLVLVMVLSIMPSGFANDTASLSNFKKAQTYPSGQFSDVKSSDWFASGVVSAYEYGLIKGASATTFNPKGNLTVAESIVLACRLHHIYHGGDGSFTQGTPWYQVYVDYAQTNTLIQPGEFSNYTAAATRAQVATILARVFPTTELHAINYIEAIPDVPTDAAYFRSVYSLYTAGVLTGSDKHGNFRPNSTIQRSEIATIVTRMVDPTQRKSVVLEPTVSFATIGDYILDRAMFEYLVLQINYMYQSQGITLSTMLNSEVTPGTTGAQFLKQQALAYAKQNGAIVALAKKHGITILADDKLLLQSQKEGMAAQMGGWQAYRDNMKEAGLSESAVDAYNQLMYLGEKVRVSLFLEDGIYAPNEADIKKDLSNNYYRIKHILVLADPTDKDFAQKKALATSLQTRAKRGEDFDTLIAKYGEDPGMQSMPDGYVIDRDGVMYDGSGTMVSEFTAASIALGQGQVSDVVQSSYGFHIIKRYPFDSAYFTAHLSEYVNSLSNAELQNKLTETMNGLTVKTTDAFENYDVSTLFNR